uniref:Polycystic kidney disease 1 like 2a n=1 Tax=Amphiprion ocellaris TaxID=80972 RepID=A0A3Q1BIH9_AMPOC
TSTMNLHSRDLSQGHFVDADALSCPENQEGFDGSCYEFVGLQRSFLSAEGWCEQGGGHLAFILNDEMQQFLQQHLQPETDWWLGLAPAAPNLTLDSAPTEGSLAWLDGSDVSYNNWMNPPDEQAACGHILRHSGFQWEATGNCSQELNFICQFDSGRSIACDRQSATLQCGSGQVIEIDDSFYGRKTIHYCRSKLTASPTSSQEECSWIDVVDSVTAHCHGLQACRAPVDLSSFGEPCPVLGSYLSVEYRCKHGLQLLLSKLAAVFDNVTITVKWLLHPFQGNLTCTLSAGDGHTIDPYNPEEMESTIIHKFTRPGVFMVGVECNTSDWHVTAQKAITIQEPVGEFLVIKCYSRNISTEGTKCKALYGTPVQIQLMVKAAHLIANSSVKKGNTPHNITLNSSVVEKLGHGCHSLTLSASNRVTTHTVSSDLELCLLEPIESLQASVIAENDVCPDSADLIIGVSLERGAPAELLFTLTGAKDTLSETRDLHNDKEKFTWVLSPKDRTGDVGVHYLVLKPIVEPGVKSINATVTVVSIAAQCKYWNETDSSWSEDGCRVGPLTTHLVTQCLCNHLTFFGSSFFVMPNLVDVSRTAELFATFTNNPVVVCFVGAIFAAYLFVVVWARRKDIQDSAKVKITVLEDNDPLAEYRYILNISTGHRHGASTSSQVTITLLGTEGESEPHHLTDSEKPVFERGGVDMFLLTTHFSLGDLQSIRMWHDNSGEHPAWYVNKVMVQDLETGQKWHFLCNSWLAVDVAECTLDKVFPVATDTDLKRFSNLFFMKTAKDFRDGHIWFSVISRPPCSTFTRVQRVSCCFSLLLCTMLTSIMFWGIPTDPSEQTMDLGHIEFTWQQVMIGIQSSVIMFPINLLIVSIFRNTRPREKASKTDTSKQGKTVRVSPSQTSTPQKEQKDITPDTVIKVKSIAQSLSKAMKSPLPHLELHPGQQADINTLLSLVEDIIRQQNRAAGDFYTDASKKDRSMILTFFCLFAWTEDSIRYLYRQLRHVEKELSLLGPTRFPNPNSYSRAMQQVQGMKGLLEYHLPSSSLDGDNRSPSPEESIDESTSKKCCQGGLPWWFVFVGWILVIATSGVSGYFTMMYGLTYGKDRSVSWLISMVVSFFESLFITQPLKVLGFATFFALILKKVDQEEYGEPQIDERLRNQGRLFSHLHFLHSRRDSTCSFYQPPPPTDIERMRSNMVKEQKVFALVREILAYMGFMWMLLLVAYGQRDPNAYFLTQHIRQSFSKGISDTMSIQDVFNWANTTLLSNLFGEYPGFITDGNSKLVGNARLRQVRVQKNSCHVDRSMQRSVPDCHAPYSWELEDMGSYGLGWSRSVGDNASVNHNSPWTYRSQSKLRAYPIWGSVRLYRGGGFVVDLGPDLQNSSRILQYLYDNTWIDVYTQAIFVEFTVYNANVNLFCIVTLMLETTFRSELQSVRLYQSTGGLHIFVMASEAIYFLFIIYYMVIQGKLMRKQKWSYFKSKWNLLELVIIILSWSALSVFIKRTLLGKRDMNYYQNNKDQYASFHETAKADAVLGYLIAFLVLLATVKLWHLLRLNPKLHMITATLQRAWTDISGFLVVMTIMFLAYSIASNLMYGWKLYSYRTLLDAAQTMVSLQLGIFNYEEVLNYNPVLGAFLIGSCIVFMTFVVLNLFISVILVAFSQEQIHHKPSEEDEIVDLMLMKLCSLFGLKCKKQGGGVLTERPTVSSAPINRLSTISSGNIHEG